MVHVKNRPSIDLSRQIIATKQPVGHPKLVVWEGNLTPK